MPQHKWELFRNADAGLWLRNVDSNDVIFLSWQDIAVDIAVKKMRAKFEKDWPAIWKEIKQKLPQGYIDATPAEPRRSAVEDVGDIYWLTKADLLQLPSVGSSAAEKLLISIGQSKTRPLHKVVFGLGIRYVGEGTAKLLAQHFPTIYELGFADYGDFFTIRGLGPMTTEGIIRYFKHESNWKAIEKMRRGGVDSLDGYVRQKLANPLEGKKFVFTGALHKMTRTQAHSLVESMGGAAGTSVTNSTDYVIVGDKPGSKLIKASLLGVPTMSEDEFDKMIQSTPQEVK